MHDKIITYNSKDTFLKKKENTYIIIIFHTDRNLVNCERNFSNYTIMQLSRLNKRRERTLSVRFPHTIKDKKEVECLFTGNFYVKMPRQSSRACHVIFSSVEEKLLNRKSAKNKTINGKQIVVKPLRAVVLGDKTKKIERKKLYMPEIKPDIKITQTLFVSNIVNGTKLDEIRAVLPGCVQVTLLKPYNKNFRSAIAKMESMQVAAEYLKTKSKWPILKGHRICFKIDTRTKHKRRSAKKILKIHNENTIKECKVDEKAQIV